MKEIKAILRKERVQAVVSALKTAGVPRLTVSHVHSLGAGVDPEDYRLSMEEGGAYTEKAKLELVCNAHDVPRLLEIVRREAKTGERGDGVIFVTNIEGVTKIRTGDQNELALL
jgi:nitrogen regulatory protein P-II 1